MVEEKITGYVGDETTASHGQKHSNPKSAESSPEKSGSEHSIPNGGLFAWIQVLGSFFIFFNTWGYMNSFGAFQTYYETQLLHTETASNISWVGSIQAFLLLFVGTLTGPIYDAGYMRSLLYVGTFCNILGMMMTSISHEYYQVFLAQGVAVGIGDGCLFLTSLATVPAYFTTKRGFATGIASLGSSIGGIVYPIIFHQLQPTLGFGWATRIMGFIALATSTIYLAGTKQRDPPEGRPPRRKLVELGALRDVPFMLYNAGVFFVFMGIYIAFFYIQLYAIEKVPAMPSSISLNLLSIINAGSVFGRLVPGYLSDKIGPLNVQIPFAILSGLLTFCWIRIEDTAGLVVFCVLYGFFSGAFVSIQGPTCVSLCPDLSLVGTRLGMAFGFAGFGLLIGSPVAGAILRGSGGWVGLQCWCGVILFAAALCMFGARVAKVSFGFMKKA